MIIDKNLTNEQKLEVMYELTVENHDMLKTIRRQQYFSSAAKIFYWLIILGVVGGAYLYIRPLIEVFTSNSGQIESSLSQYKAFFPEGNIISQFIDAFQKMRGH